MPHTSRAIAGQLPSASVSPTFGTGPRPFTEGPLTRQIGQGRAFGTTLSDKRRQLELALIEQEVEKARTEAATRQKAETEARLADPLERAKSDSAVAGFRSRRDITPEITRDAGGVVRGVRGISGEPTELSRAAGIARSPDFPAAVEAGQAAPFLPGAGNLSPGVTIASIQQQTSELRSQGQQELQRIRDSAAAARQTVTESGLDDRQAIAIEVQIATGALKTHIDLINARRDALRFDRNFRPGIDQELERQLGDAQTTLQQYELLGRSIGIQPSAADVGGDARAEALAILEGGGITDPTEEEIQEIIDDLPQGQ